MAAIANIVRRTPAARRAGGAAGLARTAAAGRFAVEAPVAMTHAQALSLSLPPSEDAATRRRCRRVDDGVAGRRACSRGGPGKGAAAARATAHRKVFRQLRTLRRLHARGEHADASLEVDFACPACLKWMLPSKVKTLWPSTASTICAAAAVRSPTPGAVAAAARPRAGPNPAGRADHLESPRAPSRR